MDWDWPKWTNWNDFKREILIADFYDRLFARKNMLPNGSQNGSF